MNVLFLTLLSFDSLQERTIYTDLLREFVKNGHQVYAISPTEKRQNIETHIINEENTTILRLQIGNTQKTNIIEKGISTLMIEPLFKRAIKKYFNNIKFDLIMYSTPPITLLGAVKFIKKRDNAKTYLLLKDIFPQNAVDIGMMTKSGVKGLLYKYFRNKEKHLYGISDRIGCMSQANVDYVIKHNPEIDPTIVEVCPNSMDVQNFSLSDEEKKSMRIKYNIPTDKKVFVYGGNLGKPQGIPFIIDCLRAEKDNKEVFFLIVGDGTEFGKLEAFVNEEKPANVKLMKRLPKEDYDRMVASCDVGLIFLDRRFTIPNFPSRLLYYMQAGIPVLACTDTNTDIGKVIVDGGFGWWCWSGDASLFTNIVEGACAGLAEDKTALSRNSFRMLTQCYNVNMAYNIITNYGLKNE